VETEANPSILATAAAVPSLRSGAIRIIALLVLFSSASVYEAHRVAAFVSGDLWWHLRTGLWIISHHAVPSRGLFSQVPDRSWVDSDWGFEVLLGAAYRILGLRAASLVLMMFKSLLAGTLFLLAGGWRKNFWGAVLLSAVAQYVFLDLPLVPMLGSILCYGIELMVLFESRRKCNVRYLWLLPPLFFLWANLHVQFVNGLLVLALFVIVGFAERLICKFERWKDVSVGPSPLRVLAVALLSFIATLITPNGFHLFTEFLSSGYGAAQFKFFAEMRALQFRQPQDFVFALLVMSAFLAMGWRRPRDIFQCTLMVFSTMLAFRVSRDGWMAVLPSIACIAAALPQSPRENDRPRWRIREACIAVALGVIVTLLAFSRIPSNDVLMERASRTLPVKACDFLRSSQVPGPMFHENEWSGFLIWYLPEYPVMIDSRLGLYGERAYEQYFNTVEVKELLEKNPSFLQSRIILLRADSGLAKGLTTLPMWRDRYHVAYEDQLAIVLVRN
jgi:hypothetical protein